MGILPFLASLVLIAHEVLLCNALENAVLNDSGHYSMPKRGSSNAQTDDRIVIDRNPTNIVDRKSAFTWKISAYPITPSKLVVDYAFYKAAKMWSTVTYVSFVHVENEASDVDIDAKFMSSNYDSACDKSFRDGEMAHVVRNTRGGLEIHFNGDVTWNEYMPIESTFANANLAAAVAHQFGHILGLNHSSDPSSIMFSNGIQHNTVLGDKDIRAVQALHGTKDNPTFNSCPSAIRDPFGRPQCAVVYRKIRCNGDALSIAPGNITSSLNMDWLYEISSAQVNKNCTLRICRSPDLKGNCTNFRGMDEGLGTAWNISTMPRHFDKYAASLACACGDVSENTIINPPGQCPAAAIAGTTHNMCAVVYKDAKCAGARMDIKDGDSANILANDWYHAISSAQVAAGCQLSLCNARFLQSCLNFNGGVNGTNAELLPTTHSGFIESLACSCMKSSASTTTVKPAQSSTSSRARCLTALSQYMPNGYTRLCAKAYKGSSCSGDSMSIEENDIRSWLPFDWRYAISSVQVNQGCLLQVCKYGISGICKNLPAEEGGTDFTEMPDGFDDTVVKVACVCDTQTDLNSVTTTTSYDPWFWPNRHTTTPVPTRRSCPSDVTRYMPDGYTRMCAAVYIDQNCGGRRLPLEVGHVTWSLAYPWHYAISSAEVNPNCGLKICLFSYFGEPCTILTGGPDGRNIDIVPEGFDNLIAALSCTCSSQSTTLAPTTTTYSTPNECEAAFTSTMPENGRRVCATVYELSNCSPWGKLHIESGNVSNILHGGWKNEISSIQINPGCTFRACFHEFLRRCADWPGGVAGKSYRNLFTWDNEIESFSCTCGDATSTTTTTTAPSTTTSSSTQASSTARRTRLFIGEPPPVLIPNTNHRTCAVFSTGLLQRGAKLEWIQQGLVNNTLASLAQESFVYGIAATDCGIYYCPRPSFAGNNCSRLGPGQQHTNISNAQPFSIGSYICECHGDRR